jgi:NADH-quinone oxidoreductase subunit N
VAYSSIAHAGYLLLAIATTSGSPDTLRVIWYYLVVYGVMFIGLLGGILLIEKNTGHVGLSHLAGLGFSHPVFSMALVFLVLSAAGIPPLAGFFAKYLLFLEVLKHGHIVSVIVAVLSSLIAMAYYLNILVHLYMKEPSRQLVLPVTSLTCAVLLLCALAMVGMGVFPLL